MINFHVIGDTFAAVKDSSVSKPADASAGGSQDNINSAMDAKGMPPSELSETPVLGQEDLLQQSYQVLNALKSKDFAALSNLVHPQKGLTLTPFSTVDPAKDQTLTTEVLAKAAQNESLFLWGFHDGSGSPIRLSIPNYFEKFVYNADYSSAPMIGVNTVLSAGNSSENVAAAYPKARFVEFYYPQLDPKNNGLDWCGLKLVFEQVLSEYKLVGLIHSEWTI